MAASHIGTQLSALDASFLAQERGSAHMHLGAVLVFDGPPLEHAEIVRHIEGRLHLAPRFRQKLSFPPLGLGRPFWVDDPFFDVGYHVRDAALPAPGTREHLRTLADRIYSQRLDRTKPLWELWVVAGLEDGRFALISKTHHALFDGIAGIDLVGALFDTSPKPAPVEPPERAWTPRPEPSEAELVVEGIRGLLSAPRRLAARVLEAVEHPDAAVADAREAAEGVAEVIWSVLNPAPTTPFNTRIGSHRRIYATRARLDDFRLIRTTLGGTVNDVLLAVVTGALRSWLPSHGVRTEGLELSALVPVSVRTPERAAEPGNHLLVLRGVLPVYCPDPVERLALVCAAMHDLKHSKQALGAHVIQGLQELAPPALLGAASRINFSTRLFNLLVTNVPGPQHALYLLGRELVESIPVAFLAEGHGLAVAIMSYNGWVEFGLLSDADAVPDLDELARHLDASLAELFAAAQAAQPKLAARAAQPSAGQ